MLIDHRNKFPEMFNDMGLDGIGVEVGVHQGVYSDKILKTWKGKKLYLIDSWKRIENAVDFINDIDKNGYLNAMAQTFMKVYDYGSKAVIIRESSVEAARLFSDWSLDFVYIDASHDYNNVKNDLNAWYPKVKTGGVVSGHDYANGTWEYPKGFVMLEVKKAVDEFFKEIPIAYTKEEISETFPSWYVIKGE